MCTFLSAGSSFGFAKKDLKQKVACLAEVASSAVDATAPQHLLWKLTGCAVAVVQRETLEQIAPKLPTLNEVVAADKKAGLLLHGPAWVCRKVGMPDSSHSAGSLWLGQVLASDSSLGPGAGLASSCISQAQQTVKHFAQPPPCTRRATSLHLQLPRPTCNAALQAGTVTVKNSPSRNLHRLLSSVSFIAALLQNLAADPKTSLHTAAASAYNNTMSPMHNFMVTTLLGQALPPKSLLSASVPLECTCHLSRSCCGVLTALTRPPEASL